jgi:1,5-anhydro-D-fructose reductase (1,5-anhydro-D-mannitol-forming)
LDDTELLATRPAGLRSRAQRMGAVVSERLTPDPLHWALVGASTIAGAYMASAISNASGSELTGVASGDAERARQFAEQHNLSRAYRSLEELWADPEVDAVYISSINALHATHTVAAAEAGKHVLCEKPLATSVADGVTMIEACQRSGVLLGVDHNLRCAPAHVTARRLIADGRLGRVLSARVLHAMALPPALRRWRTHDPAAGGGAAFELTVHDADLLRFLFQDEVTEVTAFVATLASDTVGVEDTLAGMMRFSRGALATFHDSLVVPFSPTSLSIHGDNASLYIDDAMADDPVARLTLTDSSGSHEIPTSTTQGLYDGVVAAFTAAARGDGQLAATGEDGLRAVAIVTAAKQAAALGQAVSLGT